jgi:hypothetical protein
MPSMTGLKKWSFIVQPPQCSSHSNEAARDCLEAFEVAIRQHGVDLALKVFKARVDLSENLLKLGPCHASTE